MTLVSRTVVSMLAAVALTFGAAVGASAAPAEPAATKPSVSFTLVSSKRQAGQSFKVRYATKNVRSGYKVELQRTFGTSGTFKKIASLKANTSTTATSTTPGMGKYRVRVVVKSKSGTVVAKTASKTLYSFEWVSLAELTNRKTSTVDINGSLFRYAFHTYYTDYTRVVALDRSTCRRVSLQAVNTDHEGVTGALQVVQERRDPVTVALPQNVIQSTATSLNLGAAVQINVKTGDPVGTYADAYVNGKLECWSADGER